MQTTQESNEVPVTQPSKYKNFGKVLYAGFFFLLIQSSYTPSQNLLSSLYNQKGYSALGQLMLFANWLFFALSNLLASHIKRHFNYGPGVFIGSLGYVGFYGASFYLTSCETTDGLCTPALIYLANIGGSMLCGLITPLAFISIFSYIDTCSQLHNKGFYYGILTGSVLTSQLTGSLSASFLLGDFSPAIFFLMNMIVTVIGATAFLFLPSPHSNSEEPANSPSLLGEDSEMTNSVPMDAIELPLSLKQNMKNYAKLLRDRRMQRLVFSFANSGMMIAFYSGYFYNIITNSIDSKDESVINRYTAYVFAVLGAFECVAGLVVGKILDHANKVQTLKYSNFVLELSYAVTFIAFYQQQYYLCLVAGALWGFSDCMSQTLSTTLVGTEFNAQLEAFGLFWLFQGLFGAFGFLIILFTSSIRGEYYMALMIGWQILVHLVVLGLKPARLESFSESERKASRASLDFQKA